MSLNLKAPNLGPLLHGFAVWLVADGLPILEYLRAQLTGDTANWSWDRFLLGLGAAVVTALISAGRNAGAVELKKDETLWVKGVQQDGGEAVIAQARDVVPNNENVIILRDPLAPPAATPPRG